MFDRAWKRYTQHLRQQPFFAFGLPFLVFVVVGSYGLSQFTQLRYEMKDRKVSRVSASQVASWKGKERVFDMQAEYRVKEQF